MSSSQSLLLMAFLIVVEGGVVVHRDDPAAPPQTKIVGGRYVEIGDVPRQVALLYITELICGGSIISNQWILSAAHCTVNLKRDDMRLLIGTKSLEEFEHLYTVKEVIVHEKYNTHMHTNDICLFKTTTVLNLDGNPLKAVKLPAPGAQRLPVKETLQVSGWGRVENDLKTNLLKAVDVEVRDYGECQAYGAPDESTQICAGLAGKNSCLGDSGGPLVKDDLLVGIVSFKDRKTGCGVKPNVYTDVAVFRGWITDHSGV